MRTRHSIIAPTIALLIALLAGLWPTAAPSAMAAGAVVVNNTGDQLNNNASSCTLREALDVIANIQSNAGIDKKGCTGAQPGLNTITFSISGKIVVNETLPFITSNVTITGPIIIEGANGIGQPLLRIANSDAAILSLAGLTLTKGRPAIIQEGGTLNIAGSSFIGNNGDTANGGAINSNGSLNIAGSTFSGNRSEGSDGGGAIYHRGAATMSIGGSLFNGNTAKRSAGAIYAAANATIADSIFNGNIAEGLDSNNNGTDDDFDDHFVVGGGAIYAANDGNNGRKLEIVRSIFNGNIAAPRANGGGLYNGIGSVTEVRDSSFNGNLVGSIGFESLGGGIINAGGNLSINRATLLNNTVTGHGGGIAIDRGNTVNLTNLTIVANVATGNGGGIYAFNTQQNGSSNIRADLTIRNATISQNVAVSGGGFFGQNPSSSYPTPWKFVNTIVAGSEATGGNCAGGTRTSLGNNLDTSSSCGFTASGDIQNGTAALEAPAFNGGPLADLLTQKLGVSSDALDSGSASVCAADPVGGVDQRGMVRGGDGNGNGQGGCDIGAYEGDALKAVYVSFPTAPGPIDFGNVQLGTSGQTSFAIQNAGNKPLQLSAQIPGSSEFSIVSIPPTIADGGSATLQCTPTGTAGLHTATLVVSTNDPDNASVNYTLLCNATTAPVPGYGSTPEPPGPINVGTSVVGIAKNATLGIHETGNAALSISGIQITGANAGDFSTNLVATNIADGAAELVRTVTCTPSAPGVRTATLNLTTNDPTQPQISYSLSCVGIQPPQPFMEALDATTATGNPYGLALSPDGRNLYAAAQSGDALLIFDRNTTTGALSNPRDIPLLDGIIRVLVSPDGQNVYATLLEPGDPTIEQGQIRAYARDASTGDLTFLDSVSEGQNYTCSAPCVNGTIRGINRAYGMALSPDGAYMYVSGIDDDADGGTIGNDNVAIVVLRRSADGGLAGFANNPNFVARVSSALLSGTYDLALSPDGSYLYAANYGTAPDSISIFKRDPATGRLTGAGSISAGTPATAALNGVFRLDFSPDGSFLYAASYDSDAVIVLRRNPTTGALTHVASYTNGGQDSAKQVISGLDAASAVRVSPDGNYLFTTAYLSGAVTIFERNPVTGELTWTPPILDGGSQPPNLTGARDVVITADQRNAYASAFLDNAIETLGVPVPTPALNALLPASVTAGSGSFTLTLIGEDFVPGADVLWVSGGVALLTTQYVGPGELRATVGPGLVATAGTASVRVRNPSSVPSEGNSNSLTFTILPPASNPVPSIEQISPAGVDAGSNAVLVTITGSGFLPGSAVRWNGSNRSADYIGPTTLQVQLTSADLAQATTGAITVVNPAPGGGSSNAAAFQVVQPYQNPPATLNSLSPASTYAGQNGGLFAITLLGAGFVPGAQARWNGIARPTQYVSANELVLELNGADLTQAGINSVEVVNPEPGGGASAPQSFMVLSVGQNPVPSIQSVDIAGTNSDGSTNLYVYGSGFVSGTTASWNGVSKTVSQITPTRLTITISALDLLAGKASLVVTNPAPGGGDSTPFFVTFPQLLLPRITR